MFYFVGNMLTDQITGIESAQLKRLKLFSQFGEPARIVTFGKAMNRTDNAEKFGLTADTYVNMYDFLCGIPFAEKQRVTIDDLGLGHRHRVSFQDETTRRYVAGEHLFAEAHCDAETQQVQEVYYYDEKNRSRVVELYDSRGFVGARLDYDEHLRVVSKVYFAPSGEWKVRLLYTNRPHRRIGAVQVHEDSGRIQQLTGEQDLRRYFLDRLNQTTDRNVFVCDRTLQNAWAFENMRTRAFKVFQLHNVHATHVVENPASTDWNFNYRQTLDNLDLWQYGLVLTDQQMADIALTLPPEKFLKMPAVVISPERLEAPRVPLAARTRGKIIAVARIDRQKKLKELVHVVKLIHDKRPDVTLDIWGLVEEPAYEQEIVDLIHELKLEAVVTLRGFATNISAAYDAAELMILTSRVEGTILALAEAQSHGLPVVSYDFKYGPREFIQPGSSGEIVPVDARQEAATAALTLLNDPDQWQAYSAAAYAGSARYSADKVFAYWRVLKQRAAQFYGEG